MNIAESTLTCLVGAIDTMTPTEFSKAPGTYFTRNRKALNQLSCFPLVH